MLNKILKLWPLWTLLFAIASAYSATTYRLFSNEASVTEIKTLQAVDQATTKTIDHRLTKIETDVGWIRDALSRIEKKSE